MNKNEEPTNHVNIGPDGNPQSFQEKAFT